MIRELAVKVLEFGGTSTHTRCFLHTVNLVAKSLIREFDITKRDADEALADGSENNLELDLEGEVDNDEGWVDEVELLSEDERDALERDIQPVKLALVKVSPRMKTLT
jgi:hypothetical protein